MKRYHDLDALRGFAMLLGIGLHGLLSLTFVPIWPAQDIHKNTTVYGFILNAIHGFRMPLFFLISGFFTAMMWQKKGSIGLIKHRARTDIAGYGGISMDTRIGRGLQICGTYPADTNRLGTD